MTVSPCYSLNAQAGVSFDPSDISASFSGTKDLIVFENFFCGAADWECEGIAFATSGILKGYLYCHGFYTPFYASVPEVTEGLYYYKLTFSGDGTNFSYNFYYGTSRTFTTPYKTYSVSGKLQTADIRLTVKGNISYLSSPYPVVTTASGGYCDIPYFGGLVSYYGTGYNVTENETLTATVYLGSTTELTSAGTATVNVYTTSDCDVICVGSGGNATIKNSWYLGGGSGAAFVGTVKVTSGSYSAVLGAVASGTATSVFGVSAGCGGTSTSAMSGGAAGIISTGSATIVSYSLSNNGYQGERKSSAPSDGGASVWSGYGKGGDYKSSAGSGALGYLKAVVPEYVSQSITPEYKPVGS